LVKLFFIAVIILVASSCNNLNKSNELPSPFVDTAKGFKKDYFQKKNGKPTFWLSYCKEWAKELKLDTLQNGVNNLEIRIWYVFSRYSERKLVVIRNTGDEWIAKVYQFDEEVRNKFENLTIKHVLPKSGWKTFMQRLWSNKILTLPDCYDIPGFEGGADGSVYIVEIATKSQYKLYSYWEPEEYNKELPESKSMSLILHAMYEELGVTLIPKKNIPD
jgi:hypothetical protein